MKKVLSALAVAAGGLLAAPVHAASIYVLPDRDVIPIEQVTASFELWMNFGVGEATLGGGVDIDLVGPISLAGFTPSTWFTTVADPAFTGWGTANADNDLEVHFGNFNGLSGNNLLGTITVNLNGLGQAAVNTGVNTFWGGFFTVNGAPQTVGFAGESFLITTIPEPASAALLLAGVAAVAARVRRQRISV